HVNGEVRQHSHIHQLIWNIAETIEHLSAAWTLQAGDLIFTGTPAGVGELKNGDVVDVEIEGLGKLSNPVKA
ncbi:MAG: fumarylacetoacetate hydrolase family protein, partial [Chloroflexota bacterium]